MSIDDIDKQLDELERRAEARGVEAVDLVRYVRAKKLLEGLEERLAFSDQADGNDPENLLQTAAWMVHDMIELLSLADWPAGVEKDVQRLTHRSELLFHHFKTGWLR